MTTTRITRRRLLGTVGAAAAELAACHRSDHAGPALEASAKGALGQASGAAAVKVGLLIPQAGVYAPLGADMKRGWELYLGISGGKLGNRPVTTIVADEGDSPQTGVPAVQKLLQSDHVDILVGVVSSAVALGSQNLVKEAKKLLLVTNAGAGPITGAARSPYIWRTSFTNAQIAAAMGQHLSKVNVGPVYVLAPDYAAGVEAVGGFRKAFEAGGGKIVGEGKPAFGKTQDYQPFLAPIRKSGAKAVFSFFAGGEAVAFVKQYHQFGLSADIPLYGSGFLTEGGVLNAEGDAAVGIQTALHYSSELQFPANQEFVSAFRGKYGAAPPCYAVQTWDAAKVLDRALAKAAALDGDSLAKALEAVGTIQDSPRGPWSFEGQSPKQIVYLRKVEKHGDGFVNGVVSELGVFAQSA